MRGTGGGSGRSIGLVAVVVLALLAAGFGAETASPGIVTPAHFALVLSTGAVVLALAGMREIRSGRLAQASQSGELDGFSQRLIRLETRLASLDGSGSRASSTITDMAGDVSALSAVVRDLAEALAAQEREVASFRAPAEPGGTFRFWAGADRNMSADVAVVPSFFPAQDRASGPPPAPARSVAAEALEAGRIDLHVQPVVSLPQRHPRLYEVYALLRSTEGAALVPEEYADELDRAGLSPELDAKLLARAMSFARRLSTAGHDVPVGIALSPLSLAQPGQLARLLGILEADAEIAPRIVFDVPQADWAAIREGVTGLVEHGVSFSLGRITDRRLDPPALARAGVRYVKVVAADLIAPGNEAWAQALPVALSHHDIRVIADRVTAEGMVPELIDLEVPLAQGLAFSLPSPVSTVLEGLRPNAASAPPTAERRPVADRMPLRNFLKRSG